MKPVASMTGFAVATRPTAIGPVSVELKSVNSRFLDLSVRYPDELRSVEPALREAINARIARGKVECRLGISRVAAESAGGLNLAALARLKHLASEVAGELPDIGALRTIDVLSWPGVVDAPVADPDALRAAVLAALGEALEALAASRQREGAALRDILLASCSAIDAVADQLKARVPDLLNAVERKLVERLEQALGRSLAETSVLSRDEIADRIRQEVTLYGLKMDVDEELKRLATHVNEVRRVLQAGGPVGRRLDFLMQELNREANTLGSKAAAIEMTNASVELKILIEQMREQIQNLE
ncbi:MAG TPA: YicC family protein [Burkholderiaceae bacterium]|nr:YicC family protein [Burkholderiaceae bacterium]HQR75378.1 YicC family protein [Burkholderiaceae bacterium]